MTRVTAACGQHEQPAPHHHPEYVTVYAIVLWPPAGMLTLYSCVCGAALVPRGVSSVGSIFHIGHRHMNSRATTSTACLPLLSSLSSTRSLIVCARSS